MDFVPRDSDWTITKRLVWEIVSLAQKMRETANKDVADIDRGKLRSLYRNAQQVKVLAGTIEKLMLTYKEG